MTYKVTRKEVKTGRIFVNECNQDQINNITKYPSTLYSLESIEPITEQKPVQTTKVITTEKKPTINTVKELNRIIRWGKRDIKDYIQSNVDRTTIFHLIELIKKDCNKYAESNKTTKQIYFNFLTWLRKIDRELFPEYQ